MAHAGRQVCSRIIVGALVVLTAACGGSSSHPAALAPVSEVTTEPSVQVLPASTVNTQPGETTTTAGSLPYTGPDYDKLLSDCDQAAQHARITYQPKKQMTVAKVNEVVVAADTVEGSDTTTTDAFAGAATTVVPAELSCHVQARLSGEDFHIGPEGYQDRSFLNTTHVDWSWQVKPDRSGSDLQLTLEIQGIVHTPDEGDLPTASRTFRAKILVESEPEGFWTHVNDAVSGFFEHPAVKFVGAGGLLGIVLWIVRRARGKPGGTVEALEKVLSKKGE